ncbi:hypothetical protein HDU92_003084 [Lobulomyces angularis]|nr:hypothetical protein HDU92_003084 [Lobulomyces angularis]
MHIIKSAKRITIKGTENKPRMLFGWKAYAITGVGSFFAAVYFWGNEFNRKYEKKDKIDDNIEISK